MNLDISSSVMLQFWLLIVFSKSKWIQMFSVSDFLVYDVALETPSAGVVKAWLAPFAGVKDDGGAVSLLVTLPLPGGAPRPGEESPIFRFNI